MDQILPSSWPRVSFFSGSADVFEVLGDVFDIKLKLLVCGVELGNYGLEEY